MSYEEKLYVQYMDEANHYTSVYKLRGAHNGAWDAFRHAYSSAAMTQDWGPEAARIAGEYNEVRGDAHGQPSEERNMDSWNNAVGRAIGRIGDWERALPRARLAQLVYEALQRGDLITELSDERRYDSSVDRILANMIKPWVS